MFRKLALSGRVTATVVSIIVVFLSVCGWLAISYRNAAYENKRIAIRQIVEVGSAVVEHYVALEKKGTLSGDEARRQAIETLRALRYDKDQYFWVNDMHPRMVMHPTNAALNGKDLTDYKDPTGRAVFMEMVDVVKKSGAGLVEYQWPKPGSKDPEPKFSYVERIPEWDWVVGSGIYVDNVEREIRAKTLAIGLLTLFATLAAAVAVVFLLRSTVRPLLHAVSVLGRGADEVTEASHQVAAASQSLAQGATTQAAALEQTSASMEEMASMTRKNAESAERAAGLMSQTETLVQDANRALDQLVAAMNGIQASSTEVAKIIKTIDEIAFQTNILALNAAVEAARAGEAGMGFAVVADEVRNLAQRAAQAARDTSALIEQAGAKAQDGGSKVTGVATVTAAITTTSHQVKALVDEITTASREQTKGIDQVSQAVVEMERLTQTTAATAEESAAASEELSAQAQTTRDIATELGDLVGVKTRDNGPTAVAAGARTRANVVPMRTAAPATRVAPAAQPRAVTASDDTGTFGRF